MSVPKSKRKESKFKVFEVFSKMYSSIVFFVAKDFGIKRIVRDSFVVFTDGAKMVDEDLYVFKDICQRYNICYEEEYPLWILDKFRNNLFDHLDNCRFYIIAGNSIYPNTEYEYNLRREYCHKAIIECQYVLNTFQQILFILPVNIEKYNNMVSMIDEELTLLREWKKSTNKTYKKALEAKKKQLAIKESDTKTEEKSKNNSIEKENNNNEENLGKENGNKKNEVVDNTGEISSPVNDNIPEIIIKEEEHVKFTYNMVYFTSTHPQSPVIFTSPFKSYKTVTFI